MELTVYNISGEDTGRKIELENSVFGIEPSDHAIYLAVKQYLANQRQGTHKAKERGDITGSTRKIKKQKGTGTARAGSIKSPLFRGGGRVFGPRPRDYSFKLNKKLKVVARKSALTYKMRENQIKIIENFNFEQPKTKELSKIRTNFKLDNKKALLVLPTENKNIYLSSRNLEKTKVVLASDLTTYDIMNYPNLLLVEGSVEKIQDILGNK